MAAEVYGRRPKRRRRGPWSIGGLHGADADMKWAQAGVGE